MLNHLIKIALIIFKSNLGIFTVYKRNKRHITSPYNTFEVDSLFDCADACVYDTPCKSINLDKNNDPWKCELIVDDRNTKDEYVDATGVHHYDTGLTALTIITNNDGSRCLVSEDLLCDFTVEWIKVFVETDTNICNSHRAALFYYDVNHGYLIHHCSGRPVSPVTVNIGYFSQTIMGIRQTVPVNVPEINDYRYTIRRDFSK